MHRRYSTASLLLAILFGLGSLSWAQEQTADRFHWTGKLAADKVLEIKNVNGEIDASGVAGDQIEVTALKSGIDRDEVKVELVNTADGVTICAVYPGNTCEGGESWHSHTRDIHAKVDFTVRLPRNLRFTAVNVNGRVQTEGLGRFVKATTVNGSVDVATSSWAQATSVNGSVHVSMGRADWQGTLKITSVNGSVELNMPTDLNADVHFSSVNGQLRSDFPVTISGNSGFRWGPKSMRGRIGSGGRDLEVSTVNGSVDIRKGGGGAI